MWKCQEEVNGLTWRNTLMIYRGRKDQSTKVSEGDKVMEEMPMWKCQEDVNGLTWRNTLMIYRGRKEMGTGRHNRSTKV
jgi:hypothetical protein